jgi:hypothetical protein
LSSAYAGVALPVGGELKPPDEANGIVPAGAAGIPKEVTVATVETPVSAIIGHTTLSARVISIVIWGNTLNRFI